VVAPTTIVFSSNRALDGSDADNNGVFNVWAIKSDGSVATPLTHLTTVAYPGETSNPVFSPDGSKIVFSSGAALDGSDNPNGAYGTLNIWVMNADGSGAKPLTKVTSAQMDCRWPVWSPDGSKIAYYSQRALDGSDIISSDPYNIWVLSADGSNDVPITQLTAYAADSLYPRWSPDGTKFAVTSSRALDGSDAANGSEPYTANVWVMNVDGSGAIPITTQINNFNDSQSVLWSPDGSKVVFSTLGIGGADNIWMAHPDGSSLTNITNLSGGSLNSVDGWSPNGAQLTFTSTRSLDGSDGAQEKENVWSMNADGTKPKPLTRLTVVGAADGVWSPDGTRIAYYSPRAFDGSDNGDSGDVLNIWQVDPSGASGSPVTKLTKAISTTPQWLP